MAVWAYIAPFPVVVDGVFVPCQIVWSRKDSIALLASGRVDAGESGYLSY
jgi:hypothetical protein